MSESYNHLLEPITIRGMRLKNRMISAPMGSLLASEHGYVTQELKEIYRVRAHGGFSLIVVEATAVREDGFLAGRMLVNGEERAITGLAELADVIHENGSKASLQIFYAGGVADSRWTHHDALTPSGISLRRVTRAREMTGDDVEELLDSYVAAADRTRRAGFDTILIHMAHGVIPWQFMNPNLNKRADKWGDPLAFPLEVIKRIRQTVGEYYPLGVRVSGDDFIGAVDQKKILEYCPRFEAAGIDLIDVSAGLVTGDLIYDGWFIQPVYKPRGCIVYLAEEIKKVVRVPVVTAGRLCDPDLCEKIVAEGRADIVGLGRVAYADPEFPNKVIEGRPDDIRKCTACDHCTRMTFAGLPARCATNFEIGRLPWEYEIRAADERKKVMVIGGGVGGMETARVAALRKHDVTLYEKDSKLGGAILNVAGAIPRLNTRDLRNIVRWQTRELDKLGVKVELGREITAELVAKEKPDVVFVATGAKPLIPEIPGINSPKVITNEDYIMKRPDVGNEVAVLGGGYGLETALSLERDDKKVTLVEPGRREGRAPYLVPRVVTLRGYLKESSVRALTGTKIKEIKDEGVLVEKEGKEELIKADTIILALGKVPDNRLGRELKGKVPELYEIGDCVEPSHMMGAIHTANRVGRLV